MKGQPHLQIRKQNVFVRQRSDFDWESDSLKYMILDNDVEKLNEIISELINEKPEYCQFINNISVCFYDRVAENLRYLRPIAVDLLELASQTILNQEDIIINKIMNSTFDMITFTEFGISELPFILTAVRDYDQQISSEDRQGLITNRPNYLNYNSEIDDDRYFKEFCFNIDPKFNYIPKKSNITFEHIKKSIVNNRITISIEELIFIGPANILAAVAFFNGTFLIRWSTFKSYLEEFGKNITKDLLHGLFDRFVFHLLKNHGRNIANMEEYVKNRVTSALTKEYRGNFTNSIEKYESGCDDNTDKNSITNLKNDIIQLMDTQTKSLIKLQLSNDKNMIYFKSGLYDNLLKKIFKRVLTQVNNSKNISFLEGLKCGKMFDRLGWTYVDDISEIPSRAGSDELKLWWKKDININPDRFCRDGKIYQINDEQKHLIKIQTLYVCSDGQVRATQTYDSNILRYGHPNIGLASNVCLGDLKLAESLLKIKVADFENFLNNVSIFLQMINFDSPFTSCDREFYLKNSKLMYQNEVKPKLDSNGNKIPSKEVTFKKIKPVGCQIQQTSESFMIRTDNIKETSLVPKTIGRFVSDYTEKDIATVIDIIRNIERTRSPVSADKLINWNICSVWLHPNGTSYFYLHNGSYQDCFYQKNKYSYVYPMDLEREFNSCIKICRLIKVGKLLDCYNLYLTKDNIVRFIDVFLNKQKVRDISISDIISKISYTIAKKQKDISEKKSNEESIKEFSICGSIPNPIMFDFGEFFDKIEVDTNVVIK